MNYEFAILHEMGNQNMKLTFIIFYKEISKEKNVGSEEIKNFFLARLSLFAKLP